MRNKLIISLCSNIVTFYFTGLSNIWAHEQANNNKNIYPLQDIGFKLIDYNRDYLYYNDYVLGALLSSTFVFLGFQKNKKEIILRWSIMLNILFTLRIIMIPSTILTRPVEIDEKWGCKTEGYDYNGLFGPFEIIFQNKMTCYDFIFSGHMVNTCICILILIKYLQHKSKYLLWLICIVEAFFIIITRSHYLIDINVAIVLTILVWIILEQREKNKEIPQNIHIV